MNPEEIVERIMAAARKSGAAEYEVYLLQKRSLAIAAKEGRIDQVRRNDELAASVRLIDRGRLGFSYTSVFTPEAIDKVVGQAADGLRNTDEEPGLALPAPPAGYPVVDGFDPEIGRVSQEEKMARVLAMEAAAKDFDPRVERVRQAEYGESEFTVRLVNNRGLDYTHTGTVFSGGVSAKAVEGGEAEMGYEGDFARKLDKLDLRKIGREAAKRAVDALGGRMAPSGKGPILLENSVASEFLDVLSGSFLADNVRKGKSMLAGRVGQKIMSDKLRIVDDGLYPGGLATSPADSEGVPKQTTDLIVAGELEGYLYDTLWAAKEGCVSTGNAGRGGVRTPPGVSTSNLILMPGDLSFEEMGRKLDRGLLVLEALGVHTADSISGDFSFGVSGMWYENGRPSHPVKGMALAGNILTMMSQVLAVGKDLRLFGSTGAPSLLVDGLSLGGL